MSEAGVYIRNKPIVLWASYNNKNRPYTEVHRTINNLDAICINKIYAIQ